jgi:hypothetical protein
VRVRRNDGASTRSLCALGCVCREACAAHRARTGRVARASSGWASGCRTTAGRTAAIRTTARGPTARWVSSWSGRARAGERDGVRVNGLCSILGAQSSVSRVTASSWASAGRSRAGGTSTCWSSACWSSTRGTTASWPTARRPSARAIPSNRNGMRMNSLRAILSAQRRVGRVAAASRRGGGIRTARRRNRGRRG